MDTITTFNMEEFKNSIFFSISVTGLSFKKQVRDHAALSEYLALLDAEIAAKQSAGEKFTSHAAISSGSNGIDKNSKAGKATSTTKTLLQSPALDALRAHLTGTKQSICALPQYGGIANPSGFMEGLFEVHKDLVPRVNKAIADARAKLNDSWIDDKMDTQPGYITAFLADYPAAIERARTAPLLEGGLGPLFRSADYPSTDKVASAFDIDRRWLALGVPEGLPPELREQAAAELKADLRNAADTIKNALAEGLLKLIDHAADTLKAPGPGEKPKIVKESLIGNVLQFCEVFSLRNTQGDDELAALVEQAKATLTGIDAEKLRTYPSAKDEVSKKFTEIAAQLDTMIESRKSRKLYLDE